MCLPMAQSFHELASQITSWWKEGTRVDESWVEYLLLEEEAEIQAEQ